jgi:hypothetical protein
MGIISWTLFNLNEICVILIVLFGGKNTKKCAALALVRKLAVLLNS